MNLIKVKKFILLIIPLLILCSNSSHPDILNHIEDINSSKALLNATKFNANKFYNDKSEIEFANAVDNFNRDKMDALLKDGVDINSIGTDSISFLCWAFIKYKKNSYKYLLENGADITAVLKGGNTMLTFTEKQNDRFYRDITLEYNPNK